MYCEGRGCLLIISAVPRRYAQALLMIAVENEAIEQYETELNQFRRALLANPSIEELLKDARVAPEKKKRAVDFLIEDFASPLVRNFLYLLIDKKREKYVLEVVAAYQKYADEARNIIEAEVWSVVELTSKDRRDIKQKLTRLTGKKIRLHNHIEPSLLGGIKIKVGDLVIDSSVTKKLAFLKEHVKETRFKEIGVKK